jgi:hypothetical protein
VRPVKGIKGYEVEKAEGEVDDQAQSQDVIEITMWHKEMKSQGEFEKEGQEKGRKEIG